MKYFSIFVSAICLMMVSCSGSKGKGGNSTSETAPFVRLDRIVSEFPTMTPQRQFATVDSFAIPFNDYIYLMGVSTGDIASSIDSLSHTAAFAMFEPEVEKKFHDVTELERNLGVLNANMKQLLPKLPTYSYYGIVSPYRQQVILVDSVVFVALNHYLGAEHEAYSGMPEYARKTKTGAYIPTDIAEAILSVEYPYTAGNNPTVIQYLIYEGALMKVMSELTGTSDIAELLGWSPEQMASVEQQEGDIWSKMASDNIIYSTDMSLARRLCTASPNGQPISAELPGRLGRYLGYSIVSSYLDKNGELTPAELLAPEFYNSPSVLINSGYSPK